jgi:hypothetical protein
MKSKEFPSAGEGFSSQIQNLKKLSGSPEAMD